MKLKNFIGQSYVSRNPQFDCSRAVNWMPAVDENQTGANQQISQLLCTPGLSERLTTPIGGASIRGGFTTSTGQSFFVAGTTLYALQGTFAPYTPVPLGTLFSSRGRVRFADNGQQMVLVDGQNGYYVNLANVGAGLTQINDPAFYGSNFVEFYDGYFVFAKPGSTLFYWSDQFAVTFDPLNFASKSGNADPIAGFFVFQRQLWLIGTQTTEVWYDVGGTATFQRLSGPYNEWGTGAPDTIAKSDVAAFWLGQSIHGGVQVLMTVGTGVQKVSTFSVDYQLQKYVGAITRSTGFCYQKDGSLLYQINPFNGSSSWVYDKTTSDILGLSTWHERTYTIQPSESTIAIPNGTEQRHLADCAWFYNNEVLVGSYRSPDVYAFDNDATTDNGASITRTRQAPHQNSEQNRIFFGLFRLLCQTGQGGYITVPGSTSSPSSNTTLALSANVALGACTHYGYAANNDLFVGGKFGTLTGNVFNGLSVIGFIENEQLFGSQAASFDLWLGNSGPAQNAFNYFTFVDKNGVTQQYNSNAATFTTNDPDTGISHWSWTPSFQTTYNSMDPNGAGTAPYLQANVIFNWGGGTVLTSTVVPQDPQVLLSWSDDGAYLWSNELPRSVGKVGEYSTLVEWWQLGEGRNRVFRVRCTDPVLLHLIDASINAQATVA